MIVYLILIGYIALTIGVGLFATKRPENNPEDFFLAKRKLNILKIFFTLIATNFSAFFFLGFAGEGYRVGFSYYHMMALGTSFGAISFYLIGNKAWHLGKRYGYITPIEMIGDLSKHPPLRNVYMLVMLIFMIPFLAIQPIGAGLILEQLTEGTITYEVGAGIMTLFIITYIFVGGMQGIVAMDIKNGILMMSFMLIAAVTIMIKLGGMDEIEAQLLQSNPDLYTARGVDQFFDAKKWFSFAVLWFCSISMIPQLFMRFLMSKDIETFKRTTFLYTLIPPFLFLLPVLIGVMGHISYPGLEGKASDSILPMMLVSHAPIWLGALVLTGALAAFMSTMDSILLSLSTIITRDVYKPYIDPKASQGQEVQVARIVVVCLALLSLLIAIMRPASIFVIATLTFSAVGILFPSTLCIFYWKRAHPMACVISILAGLLVLFALHFKWVPPSLGFGFLPIVPAIIVAFLCIFGLSFLLTKKELPIHV